MKRFRGGLVCKAQRLVYHSTIGRRVIKKKKNRRDLPVSGGRGEGVGGREGAEGGRERERARTV